MLQSQQFVSIEPSSFLVGREQPWVVRVLHVRVVERSRVLVRIKRIGKVLRMLRELKMVLQCVLRSILLGCKSGLGTCQNGSPVGTWQRKPGKHIFLIYSRVWNCLIS